MTHSTYNKQNSKLILFGKSLKATRSYIATTLCFFLFLSGFCYGQSIDKLTKYEGYQNSIRSKVDNIDSKSIKNRQLPTSKGTVSVSRIKGTRIVYNNKSNIPTIKVMVETSAPSEYSNDKKKLLDHFDYLALGNQQMENSKVSKLDINGYTLYGYTHKNIASPNIISSFIFFPGKDQTVYVDFYRTPPPYSYKDLAEFKKARDLFLEKYTLFIKQ